MIELTNTAIRELPDNVRSSVEALLTEVRALRDHNDHLSADNADLRERNTQLEHAAEYDGLTGLRSRGYMLRELTMRWAASCYRLEDRRKTGHVLAQPFAVLLIDIDHFKSVNDKYGHDAGDAALRAFGEIIGESIRDGDVAGRWGGEEFLVVLPHTTQAQARHLAERLRTTVELEDIKHGDLEFRMTCSIGVSGAGPLNPAQEPESIVTRADAALYEAKDSGRNRVVTAFVEAA